MNTKPIKDNSFDEIKTQKREALETERYKAENKKQFKQNVLVNIGCVVLGFILDKIPAFITWIIELLNL